jgi:hypothetical protein
VRPQDCRRLGSCRAGPLGPWGASRWGLGCWGLALALESRMRPCLGPHVDSRQDAGPQEAGRKEKFLSFLC